MNLAEARETVAYYENLGQVWYEDMLEYHLAKFFTTQYDVEFFHRQGKKEESRRIAAEAQETIHFLNRKIGKLRFNEFWRRQRREVQMELYRHTQDPAYLDE